MRPPNSVLLPGNILHKGIIILLESVGVPNGAAHTVADVLIAADLRGIESHGVARLPRYFNGVRRGQIDPVATPLIESEGLTTGVLDARNGLGQPAAVQAMRLAIKKAKACGIGIVTVRNTNHFGIAGYYALLAPPQGAIGIATCNASPQVCPTHGAEAMYGTNPIAVAMPTGGRTPFLMDMATSVVPRGKIETYRRHGRQIPGSWAITSSGGPLLQPGDLVDGPGRKDDFALLPLGGLTEESGGHKGYGLGLLVDLLCGPLAGAAFGRRVYGPAGARLGNVFIAIDVESFVPLLNFQQESQDLLNSIRMSAKRAGRDRIYIHGEKEAEFETNRKAEGIPVARTIIDSLLDLALDSGTRKALEQLLFG